MYDGHNHIINRDSVGITKALQNAQRMFNSQSQSQMALNPTVAKKLTTVAQKSIIADYSVKSLAKAISMSSIATVAHS